MMHTRRMKACVLLFVVSFGGKKGHCRFVKEDRRGIKCLYRAGETKKMEAVDNALNY